jgi:GDP-mannose 6-dehydrogenase
MPRDTFSQTRDYEATSLSISVFGLGYVGCVAVACLAELGHRLTGFDRNPVKTGQLAQGEPTVIEPGLSELVQAGHDEGRIVAASDATDAVVHTDVSFVCVGTPSSRNGHLSLEHIRAVAREIATALRMKTDYHVIAIRSTVPPGTSKEVGSIIAEESGKLPGRDFDVVSNPEFLREGSAVADFRAPEVTVIGTDSERAAERMRHVYAPFADSIVSVPIGVAELIKFVNNAFHALKVSFANEVGQLCKDLEVDAHELMRLFFRDRRLNISEKYLLPGGPYGGSCLPKDLKALSTLLHDRYLQAPLLESVERSNAAFKESVTRLVCDGGRKAVGMIGLSFKPGTDDLRNSPAVELTETLIGRGYTVHVYDPYVHLARLTGANKEEITRRIPHIEELISDDLAEVVRESDVVVISHPVPELVECIDSYPEKTFIDLVRLETSLRTKENYVGIAW